MPHWTRALKPYQDEETGETILFYPCPKIPNDIIHDILKKRTDAVKSEHKAVLDKCLEEMLEKYTIDVIIWCDKDEHYRMWISEALGIEENNDYEYTSPFKGGRRGLDTRGGDEINIYNANEYDSQRYWDWGEDEHTRQFDYPWKDGIYSYVYQ